MTTLRIYRKGSINIGFECSGHSGYAESGSDIVCAAISTAVQYCIQCGESIDDAALALDSDEDKALIRCISKNQDLGFSKHIEVLIMLAESIADQYAMYFNLEIMEV